MGRRVNEQEHGVPAPERDTSASERGTSAPERGTSAGESLAVGTGEPGGLAAGEPAVDRPAEEMPVADMWDEETLAPD